ncbi:hypothetical protein CEXT_130021 [Caerostris extrusa]|uniref:Uncharacterized protein n=1 Tax=Caerostris extrusa TaxID=172846 RepID=A0AAV4V7M4_CAEEX|nr:hypothetical protein CEXT_130021 [Caerostris extrusa]
MQSGVIRKIKFRNQRTHCSFPIFLRPRFSWDKLVKISPALVSFPGTNQKEKIATLTGLYSNPRGTILPVKKKNVLPPLVKLRIKLKAKSSRIFYRNDVLCNLSLPENKIPEQKNALLFPNLPETPFFFPETSSWLRSALRLSFPAQIRRKI